MSASLPSPPGLRSRTERNADAAANGRATFDFRRRARRRASAREFRWCVFESKPGSDWTAEKLKKVQDEDKKAWAVQDVVEINKPTGHTPYYA